MKFILYLILFIFNFLSYSLNANQIAIDKTIITTNGGIEVYQDKKYYDLINNVEIISPNFKLNASNVKAFYGKDFYDIIRIIAFGNAEIITKEGSIIKGQKIDYEIVNKNFFVEGSGEFIGEELVVIGETIKGNFIEINNKEEIENVTANDPENVYIKNKDMKSYSKSAIYSKETDVLELFKNVKIIKNQEVATGDYANINMLTNNYIINTINNSIIIDGYLIKPNDNKVQLLIN